MRPLRYIGQRRLRGALLFWQRGEIRQYIAALKEAVLAVWRYFHLAFFFTVIGLLAAAALGYAEQGGLSGAGAFLFIAAVLAVLEVSLSFDNAIINARILRGMSPLWQHRFLTWGMVIAVFGMRIIFPLLIVAIAAAVNPFAALKLAVFEPQAYAHIMAGAHLGIAAFGGTFLLMVGLSFFFDAEKEIHWIGFLEIHAQKLARAHGAETAITLIIMLITASLLDNAARLSFLTAALYGLLTYIAIEALSAFLDRGDQSQAAAKTVRQAGLGAFLYLEVLDAAFSFDGVIGAFALTANIFIIAIGLGIGAFYVRSLTVMFVERGNLSQYRYLEHGAFYAIIALALIMYAQTIIAVPEAVAGLIGAVFILAGYFSSLREKKRAAAK